jgi:hypothetical protein
VPDGQKKRPMEGGAASLGRNAGPKTPRTGSYLELGCGLHIGK